MNERIKILRKNLDLTQQKFADRIGVKQNTVAQYEIGRNTPIDSVISLICKEFNVSENWLRNGIGSMFVEKSDFSLDDYVKNHDLSDLDLKVIREFMGLDPSVRNAVYGMFQKVFATENKNSIYDEIPKTPEELESKFPPVGSDQDTKLG